MSVVCGGLSILSEFCQFGVFVDDSTTCSGATVCWSGRGKFRIIFALILTGSNMSVVSICLHSDLASASSRGGMVGEGIGSLGSLLSVWF